MATTTIEQLPETDLQEAGRLMYRAANLLRKNAGLPPLAGQCRKPLPLMQHIHTQDPTFCWGAYDGEGLAGFLVSHVRDRQWHAAYLFVDPAHQGLGIGHDLLHAGLKQARAQDMHFLSQCTFTYNLRAMGLASRFGMFPRKNLLLMRRSDSGEWSLPNRPESVAMQPITSVETVSELNRMDCEVRGVNRTADHCFWLAHDDCTGYVFLAGDRPIGYAYLCRRGLVGPVLVARDCFLTDVLVHCLHEMRDWKCPEISLWVSGKNYGVLQLLLDNGFRFHEIAILLTNRVFCDLRRYLPHSLVIL